MRKFNCLVVALPFTALLLGCSQRSGGGGNSPPPPPQYVYKVSIVSEAPGSSPRCGCNLSRAISAVNTDPINKRYAKVRIRVADASNGHAIDSSTTEYILDPGAQQFLGCSVADTSTTPQCKFSNQFDVQQESVFRPSTAFGSQLVGFGPFVANDAHVCEALCSPTSPSVSCLKLGAASAPLISPFIQLLNAAGQNPGTVISKKDLLSSYSISDADDKCKRQGISVGSSTIENVGEDCEIKISDYTKAALPIDMLVHLTRKMVASKPAGAYVAMSGALSNQILTFDDSKEGPAFGFNEAGAAPLAASSSLTDLYGGQVRSVVKTDKAIIISTSNGCISGLAQ